MKKNFPRSGPAGVLALSAFLAASAVASENERETSFFLDGVPIRPRIHSVHDDSGLPRAGDMIRVRNILLVLGGEKELKLKTKEMAAGRLLKETPEGDVCVGVRVWKNADAHAAVLTNPLARMTPQELAELRGVRLEAWSPELAEPLKGVDLERTAVQVTEGAVYGTAMSLPPLPAGLRYLSVEEDRGGDFRDLSGLCDLTALRFLSVRTELPVEAGWLSSLSELRRLAVLAGGFKNPPLLARLQNLRLLDLSYNEDLADVSFIGKLKELRVLELRQTSIKDLSAVGALDKLEMLDVEQTPVSVLPAGVLPNLRRLRILSSAVGDEAAATFAKAHPHCRIRQRWADVLREAVVAADRLCVRGGAVARAPVLFEEKDTAAIAEFVRGLEIDEAQSGIQSLFRGEPRLEFYQGDSLLASLTVHHGCGLRWPNQWPGDAALTEASAERLCHWLAERGVKAPQEERLALKRQAAAVERLGKRCRAILTEEVFNELLKAESYEALAAVFEKRFPDEVARTVVYLRLFGCGNHAWNLRVGFDAPLAEGLLVEVKKDVFQAAVKTAVATPEGLDGLARWLWGEGKIKDDVETWRAWLPTVAEAGLKHPRPFCRQRTLRFLGELREPQAIALLRKAAAAEIRPRALAAGEEVEPPGEIANDPEDELPFPSASDAARAALILARLGDAESQAMIRQAWEKAEPADREALREALRLLAEKEVKP
jgi:hypothetical protein